MRGTADDDASQRPPPRPSPPYREPESIVIQAKANEGSAFGPGAAAQPGARAHWAAGAVGGAVGAALALAGAWLWAPRAALAPLSARVTTLEGRAEAADAGARLVALEAGAHAAAAERGSLAARLSAAQAALSDAAAKLGERVAALESARAAAAAERKAAADAARGLNATLDGLQRDLAADRNESAGLRLTLADDAARLGRASDAAQVLERRLGALESAVVRPESLAPVAAEARAAMDAAAKALAAAGAPKDDARWASLAASQGKVAQQIAAQTIDIGALRARLDRIEAASAAPRSEAALAPSPAANDEEARAAARAVAAMALLRRFDAGEPVAAELAALDRLGAPPSALAPLRAYARTGAPSPAMLARAFEALEPKMLAAARPAPAPAATDAARTILGEVQGLVKIRKVGESRQSDVEDVVSRAIDALAAGDLGRTL